MNSSAFVQRLLDDAFTSLDFRALAAHLDEDVLFEITRHGDGERVVALGAERFTMPRYGVTLGGEFALLLHVCGERITRFFIIEDLSRAPEVEATALARV